MRLLVGEEYNYLGHPVRLRELVMEDEAIVETRFGERTTVSVFDLTPKTENIKESRQ